MLSVTEMMFAEPAEQVQMLADAFKDAGVSAENMDPYQKKYMLMTIQNTLGLKSQAEALKFLNASEFERGNMMAEQAKLEESRAKIQDELNQALIQSLPALEGLAQLAKVLASLLTPLFVVINDIARAISSFLTPIIMYLNTHFENFRVGIGLAAVVGLSFVSLLFSFIIAAPAAAAGAAGLSAATGALAGTLGLAGAASKEAIMPMIALAAVFLSIGFAIGIIFASAAGLVYVIGEMIVKLNETKFTAGDFAIIILSTAASLIILAGGIISLTGSLTIFLALLPLVGPAMIALALTLLPLSFSLSTVAESFTTMAESFDSMLSKIGAVNELTTAIQNLSKAFADLPQTSINLEVKRTTEAEATTVVGTATSPAFKPTEKMIAIEKVVIQFDEAGKTAFSAVVKDIVSEWADSTKFKEKAIKAQGFSITGGQQ
jgi:hypothetical protein